MKTSSLVFLDFGVIACRRSCTYMPVRVVYNVMCVMPMYALGSLYVKVGCIFCNGVNRKDHDLVVVSHSGSVCQL